MINYFKIEPKQKVTFKYIEEVLEFSKDDVTNDYSFQSDIELFIKEFKAPYFTIQCNHLNMVVNEDKVFGFPFRKELFKMHDSFAINYRADTSGKIQMITNFAQMYDAFKQTVENIKIKTGYTDNDADIIVIKKTFDRRQLIELYHIPEIVLLHSPFAINYKPGEEIKQKFHVSPGNNGALPLYGTETIKHQQTELTETLTVNKNFAKDTIQKNCINSNIFPESLQTYMDERLLQSMNFDFSEDYTITKKTDSTWPTKIEHVQVSKQHNFYKRKRIKIIR